MKRKCGVLLPVASLPSKYGIGCFSREAYDFIDFLSNAGQTYWQILPLGQTGYGDSPYQSFSTFAGNPYFIDLDQFVEQGYISEKEVRSCKFGKDPEFIDYAAVYKYRFTLLRKAYDNSPYAMEPGEKWKSSEFDKCRESFDSFIKDNESWLKDYALYSAVKKHFDSRSFMEWDDDIRLRSDKAVKKYTELLADDIRFYEFLQLIFAAQWSGLKKYANSRKIKIIGDIPIYVAFDSADTWSHPELFKLDKKGFPTVVAGCPPDGFSATGQLWGNPIYNWEYHKETGFKWWCERITNCFNLYDVVRIDHVRGIDEYSEIPYGDTTAEHGKWAPGPGFELIKAIRSAVGNKPIIAEDLGYLTPSVMKLVRKTGYPGMKVIQFAFDSREESDYLPHNYRHNCVVYTGTHDNDTTRGWYNSINRLDRKFAKDYVGLKNTANISLPFIRVAFMSVADTAIIPIQDYLDLGTEARINYPSTLGNNWKWRLLPGQLTDELAKQMKELAVTYCRC